MRVLLLLFALLVPEPAVLAQEPPPQIMPNLDLMLIVDESDSMWRTGGTGIVPADYVRRAVETLIDAFGADTLGSDFRVGIIVYGNEARLVAPFTSLRQPESQRLLKETFYQQHASMGWSDAEQALRLAAQHLGEAGRANYKPAVVILSDGKPETEFANEYDEEGRKQLVEYTEQVKAAFQKLKAFGYSGDVCPGSGGLPVYAVAIGEGTVQSQYYAPYQNFLDFVAGESGGTYFPEPEDITRLPFIFLQIFGELNCVPVGEPREVGLPADVPLKVFDTYAEFLIAAVAPDETVRMDVQLLRPDGTTTQPDGDAVRLARSDLDQVWGVRRSPGWSGEWVLRLTGTGRTRYLFIPVSDRLTVEFLSPTANTHPVGKPLPIAARLLDSRGEPVREEIVQFEVDVVNPLTHSRDGVLVKPEAEVYRGVYDKTLLSGPTDLGQRDITVRAGVNLEGQLVPVEGVKRLNLVTRPWLAPISPSPTEAYPVSAAVPLAVDVRLADHLDSTTAQTAQVEAVAFQENQQVAGPFRLRVDTAAGEARMVGEIPAATLPAGRYRVLFALLPGPTAPEGDQTEVILNLVVVPPTPTPTPTPTATPTPTPTPLPPPCIQEKGLWPCLPLWLKGILGLIPLAGLFALGIYMARLPSLDGMYFRSSRGGEEYLRGGKFGAYKLALGSIGGAPAVRLSIRAIRGQGSESESAERLAQVHIDEVHPGVVRIFVGSSPYQAGEGFILQDGDQLSVGGETWTFHDLHSGG
ncbi:MAG: VWA domain-containing protein [Candidatus Hadarchaeum sp.]